MQRTGEFANHYPIGNTVGLSVRLDKDAAAYLREKAGSPRHQGRVLSQILLMERIREQMEQREMQYEAVR